VHIDGECWRFLKGEPLVTEHSVKYSPAMAVELAKEAGWRCATRWHDAADSLSLHLLEPAD
jgi:L-histidine N-alpha-methyltransferase